MLAACSRQDRPRALPKLVLELFRVRRLARDLFPPLYSVAGEKSLPTWRAVSSTGRACAIFSSSVAREVVEADYNSKATTTAILTKTNQSVNQIKTLANLHSLPCVIDILEDKGYHFNPETSNAPRMEGTTPRRQDYYYK